MADKTDNAKEPTRFCLYDLTLLRFVGRVQSSKSKADDKSLKVEGHEYEVREV